MAELIPAPFADLVTRLYTEPRTQDALFELPRKKWYLPTAGDGDLSVRFHGQLAGNASGPAAGPHSQMAQNLLLSYIAGGRILELKTVQVNDRLTIPRPCIDVTNIGYNVEWSQELLVEQSLQEYVAGAMLIEMFRRDPAITAEAGAALLGPAGEVIYDISVGYDLAGIQSEKVQRFLDGMRDASSIVERLRDQIPRQFAFARDLTYPTKLSQSVTLSTFHGCPSDEIEKICEFLLHERGLDVIIKMNPPMLGKERLEHLLHDELSYAELTVNPSAYTSGLQFDESLQLVSRLSRFAADRGRGLGCKFSNTLEVLNHRTFFTPDNKVQYLSGQPLHVITMTLTDVFRQAVGPHVPITFSAGIDRQNFALSSACGFAPITVCSDLLRPGGYGRLGPYLRELTKAMKSVGAKTVDEYILDAFGQRAVAVARAAGNPDSAAAVRWAGLLNTTLAAEKARQDPRYRAPQNRKIPVRIDSHLVTFDCITCDKCIPVCPNAANFTYPTPQVAFDFHDLIVDRAGATKPGPARHFEIKETMQIANYADFCNECGNCDTFCPEYGGPYIKKPGFYGTIESWRQAKPRDGFVIESAPPIARILGRIKSVEYTLSFDATHKLYEFGDGQLVAMISEVDHSMTTSRSLDGASDHTLDMGIYHTLRHLLQGVLDARFVNQLNAGVLTSE